MPPKCLVALLAVFLLTLPSLRAEEKKATEEAKEAEEAKAAENAIKATVQKLDTKDAAARAAAETEIRDLKEKALPILRLAEVKNEEGMIRLRTILVDLSIKYAQTNETDANALAQLARAEALEKRYSNAAKSYKRAEKLYDRLEDDAKDQKDKEKEKSYDKKKDKAKDRKKKAERLAKGTDHKVSHWGPIPTIKKVEDDGDW